MYDNALKAMVAKEKREENLLNQCKSKLHALGNVVEGEGAMVAASCQDHTDKLAKAEKNIAIVDFFHSNITKHLSMMSQHVLECVIYHH